MNKLIITSLVVVICVNICLNIAQKAKWQFIKKLLNKKTHDVTILKGLITNNERICALHCTFEQFCQSISYNDVTQQCLLQAVLSDDNELLTVDGPGFAIYDMSPPLEPNEIKPVSLCTAFTPCQNNATCTDVPMFQYSCTCPDGFTGVNCADQISICTLESPCQNNGTCIDTPGPNYSCTCINAYTGQNCTEEIIRSKIFIHGGAYTEIKYEQFNPNNISENHLLTPKPPVGHNWHAAVVLGKKVYIIGGHYGWGKLFNTTYYYDTMDGSWHTGPVMSARRDLPGIAAIGGKIYVCGGKNGIGGDAVIVNLCEYLDPDRNEWMQFTSPHYARLYPAYAALDGYFYLIGGSTDDRNGLRTVEQYDPKSDSWTLLAPMDKQRAWLKAAPLANRYIIVCSTTVANNNTCTKYDAALNTWTDIAGTGSTNQNGPLVNLNGEIYIVGGKNGTSTDNGIKKYNPIEDKWVTVGSSVFGRNGHIAVAI